MKNKVLNIGLVLLLISNILTLPSIAFGRLSKEDKEKINELNETLKPRVPIFGKIQEPLKGSVSVLQNLPSRIELQKEETISDVIKLTPKNIDENLSGLEAKRAELQKQEEEGLNFIQPSIQLTSDEQKAIDEFFSRNDQEQLLNLWKATIERNKTIQFIVQKLSPANTPQASNSLLSKTIGAAIFLPFYALQAFTNNTGAYYGSQVGGRVLGSVLEGKMNKNQAQLQLSQTEAIILFMMIDEVAERLRQRYHTYKRLMVERALATNELEEAKKDNLDAQESKIPSAEVLANIQRRSIEREIRKLDSEVRSNKNALVELAGLVAVEELDNQLKLELAAAQNTPLDFVGVEKQ